MSRNIPGGYVQLPVRAFTDERLKATDIRVLCSIIQHCYNNSEEGQVSFQKLKKECHARLETIQKSIERLKETGWVSVKSGGKFGGDNVANTYTVHFDNGTEVVEDTPSEKQDTPAEKPTEQVSPYRKKFHKTIKPAKKDTPKEDTSFKSKFIEKYLKELEEIVVDNGTEQATATGIMKEARLRLEATEESKMKEGLKTAPKDLFGKLYDKHRFD